MTTVGLDIEGEKRAPTIGGLLDRSGTAGVVVPVAAVIVALAVGSLLILFEGENPLAVYWAVVDGVFGRTRAMGDTITAATPLALIGLGYAVAYRARVFTIGGEGQYLVGAVGAMAVVTWPTLADLPTAVLLPIGLVVAMVAGGAWGILSGWLNVRFGASVVISSLMLVYVAEAVLQWGVRDGIRDPDSFIPASRVVGNAALPEIGSLGIHLGALGAVVASLATAGVLARHRSGYRVAALGHNGEALDANEVRSSRVVLGVTLFAGLMAGLAGFVETAGVTGRLNGDSSVGFGWTAIVVALLGRLHPIGTVVAALGLAAMTIGFEASQRTYDLPSSLVGVISALIVVLVVVGDAVAERLSARGW